jgi:hypothetical protein
MIHSLAAASSLKSYGARVQVLLLWSLEVAFVFIALHVAQFSSLIAKAFSNGQ